MNVLTWFCRSLYTGLLSSPEYWKILNLKKKNKNKMHYARQWVTIYWLPFEIAFFLLLPSIVTIASVMEMNVILDSVANILTHTHTVRIILFMWNIGSIHTFYMLFWRDNKYIFKLYRYEHTHILCVHKKWIEICARHLLIDFYCCCLSGVWVYARYDT